MGKHSSSLSKHTHHMDRNTLVRVALITVSDTRTQQTDVNGAFLAKQLESLQHKVVFNTIIKDESSQITESLKRALESRAQVVIFNGGTGISKRDCTFDVISKLLEKTLTGFGELFRMLSYEQVGSAAMFSRVVAGVYQNVAIVCLPGSPKAVELAWEKLIKNELNHLAWEITK